MWLSAANPSYTVDPAIPESQIPVTDKEGNEVSLIDFIPDPNMSPEDRAILIADTKLILEDLKDGIIPSEYDDSKLTDEERKFAVDTLTTKYTNMLDKMLSQASEPEQESADEPVATPPEATALMDAIDTLLDDPMKFKAMPLLKDLPPEEFNKFIGDKLSEARTALNSQYPEYKNYRI